MTEGVGYQTSRLFYYIGYGYSQFNSDGRESMELLYR